MDQLKRSIIVTAVMTLFVAIAWLLLGETAEIVETNFDLGEAVTVREIEKEYSEQATKIVLGEGFQKVCWLLNLIVEKETHQHFDEINSQEYKKYLICPSIQGLESTQGIDFENEKIVLFDALNDNAKKVNEECRTMGLPFVMSRYAKDERIIRYMNARKHGLEDAKARIVANGNSSIMAFFKSIKIVILEKFGAVLTKTGIIGFIQDCFDFIAKIKSMLTVIALVIIILKTTIFSVLPISAYIIIVTYFSEIIGNYVIIMMCLFYLLSRITTLI